MGSEITGFDATSLGGNGGDSGGIGYLYFVPGGITGVPIEDGANGGVGGAAKATGGNGRDCNNGNGGAGGTATATGGEGGDGATGKIWAPNGHKSGDGGEATATGGNGGKGSGVCRPPPATLQGKKGGLGGAATATGGEPGQKGLKGKGQKGKATAKGGDGGDGGDGIAPGSFGDGAKANEVKAMGQPPIEIDGKDGKDGKRCTFTISIGIVGNDKDVELELNPPMPVGGYKAGTKVKVTIKLKDGSDFVFCEWTKGVPDGDKNKSSIEVMVMDRDISLVAKVVKAYELEVKVEGEGKVTVDPQPNAPNKRYKEGTDITLTANPAQGNEFKKWEGDCAGSAGNTCSLTMDSDKMAKAIFGPPLAGACQLLLDNFRASIFIIKVINSLDIIDPSSHFLELLNDPVEPQLRQLLIQMIISFIIINDSTNVEFPLPLIDVAGGFEATQVNGNCKIAAIGIGPLFDPEPNVEAQFDAIINPSTGIMNATYALGTNGTIGGQPATVEFEAQLAAQKQ